MRVNGAEDMYSRPLARNRQAVTAVVANAGGRRFGFKISRPLRTWNSSLKIRRFWTASDRSFKFRDPNNINPEPEFPYKYSPNMTYVWAIKTVTGSLDGLDYCLPLPTII